MRAVRLAAVALVLAACGVAPQDAPEDVPRDRLPSAAPSASSVPRGQARVWGVRDGRLVPVFVPVAGPGSAGRVRALLALATDLPRLSALQAGTRLLRAERAGDVLELDVSPESADLPARRKVLALGQLVLTVTEDAAVQRVRVRAGDVPLLLETSDGRRLVRPLTRADFASLTAVSTEAEPAR